MKKSQLRKLIQEEIGNIDVRSNDIANNIYFDLPNKN
jgi:hypothetical protein